MGNERIATLYVDMDGTTARFYEHADCLERMTEPGFFSSLKPYENVVKGLQMLGQRGQIRFVALSAPPADYYLGAIDEKITWNFRHLGASFYNGGVLFPHTCDSKPKFVEAQQDIKLDGACFLLDDYNKNLREWRAANGVPIKLCNEINNTGRSDGLLWDGYRIRYDWEPQRIAKALKKIIELEMQKLNA